LNLALKRVNKTKSSIKSSAKMTLGVSKKDTPKCKTKSGKKKINV